MMGYNMSFASFHVVEVMSAADFATKRVGYLAAAQAFSPTTDVLLLTTNQFKKDLTNGRMQDCSQALTCLAKLVTESLACDLCSDVAMLLSSPRPYIRKKALLVLYRFVTVYPDTLAVISERFRKCLEDADAGVVCAAVTVTCELARASPRDFLGLAPALYALLTSSSNNWMLIKIVKLMGVLTPLEPRLGKKLVGPLTNLMRTTRAKSLLYECCCTVTLGLMDQPEAVQLCGERLSEFMVDPDQNLKYLGLLSMRRLAKAYPDLVMQHRDLILDCLDDVDIGIRMRALELVSEFVTRRTLRDIARILLRKLRAANEAAPASLPAAPLLDPGAGSAPPASSELAAETAAASTLLLDPETPYRDALAEQLLVPGAYVRGEGYPILSSGDDFAWYIATVLGGLARTPGLSRHICETVASQLTELISRVEAVRPATLAVAAALLAASSTLAPNQRPHVASLPVNTKASAPEASLLDLDACTVGDSLVPANSGDSSSPEDGAGVREGLPPAPASSVGPAGTTDAGGGPALSSAVVASAAWVLGEYAELLPDHRRLAALLLAYPTSELSCAAQVALVGAAVKIYTACDARDASALYQGVVERLGASVDSELAEVHERAVLLQKLVETAGAGNHVSLRPLFEGKLLPIDPRAQASVPVPQGLDLDTPLLDTGGVDLYAFLTGDASYGADGVRGDGREDGADEDDLFHQLQQAGELKFGGGQRGNGKNPAGPANAAEAGNPFYLDTGDDGRRTGGGAAAGGPLGVAAAGADLLGVDSESLAAFSGDQAPVAVLVDDGDAGDRARSSRKKKAKRPATSAAGDARGLYGNAFQGLFDRPPPAPGGSSEAVTGDGDGAKARRRRKRKSLPRKDRAARSGALVDFEGVDAASTGPPNGAAAGSVRPGAPAHLGLQADLLL